MKKQLLSVIIAAITFSSILTANAEHQKHGDGSKGHKHDNDHEHNCKKSGHKHHHKSGSEGHKHHNAE